MKKVYIVILFFGVLFLDMSCEDSDAYNYEDVAIVNLSNDTISVVQFWADQIVLTPKMAFVLKDFLIVPPCDSAIVKDAIPVDNFEVTSQIMVFEKSTLDRYSESEIIEKNIYDTLFVYNHEQLKAMNFTIKYYGK